MSKAAKSLQDLPQEVLQAILQYLLAEIQPQPRPSPTELLVSCGRHVSRAARQVLYQHIRLQDVDALLLAAESPKWQSSLPGFPLRVLHSAPDAIQALTLVDAPDSPVTTLDNHAEASNADLLGQYQRPLDPVSLSKLLTKLPNLQHFTWAMARQPPLVLNDAFKDLTKLFSLRVKFSVAPVASLKSSTSGGIKWHASLLHSVPHSLRSMSLSALSPVGLTQLQQVLPALRQLQHLEINDTPSLDDATLAACGQKSASLQSLTISNMSGGGKPTEKGFKALFEHAKSLQEFTLVDFEGRLKDRAWSKIDHVLSPAFRKLTIAYNEAPAAHHSWFMDHVTSGCLASFLRKTNLKELRLERIVQRETTEAPLLQQARLPIDQFMRPIALPEEIFHAVLGSQSLTTLCLDLFTVNLDLVQRFADEMPDLQQLQVMVEAPLLRVLTLNITQNTPLRELYVSLGPHHQPKPETVAHVDTMPMNELRGARSAAVGFDAYKPDNAPTSKDIRKFSKKTKLEEFRSIGRGGLGAWSISRTSPAALPKVVFTSTSSGDLLGGAAELSLRKMAPTPGGQGLPTEFAQLAAMLRDAGIDPREDPFDYEDSVAEADGSTEPLSVPASPLGPESSRNGLGTRDRDVSPPKAKSNKASPTDKQKPAKDLRSSTGSRSSGPTAVTAVSPKRPTRTPSAREGRKKHASPETTKRFNGHKSSAISKKRAVSTPKK